MQLAVVIVNFRTPRLVVACLESILPERSLLPGLQVVVVDNNSGDDSAAVLSATLSTAPFAEWVTFLPLPLNGGFGWGNNQAILHLLRGPSPPDAILLLNPDTRIEPGAIVALAGMLEDHPDAGAVGSQLLDQNGAPTGSAFRFPSIGREFVRGCGLASVGRLLGIAPTLVQPGTRGPVDWVTGASVVLRVAALRDAGLFDTGFFLYFEEVELMHRLNRSGWRCYHCPASQVMHIAGASTGVTDSRAASRTAPPDYLLQSRTRYFALTGGRLQVVLANLAWLCGTWVGTALKALARRTEGSAAAERRSVIRLGLTAGAKASRPQITPASAAPGAPPAWMA